jgi:hypothetical protein
VAKFQPTNDPSKADASPTKAFFVDIITRDIQLDEAIQDLVDNCIDGAKRLRPNAGDRYDDLWVRLQISPANLVLSDNCGGIPLDIARHYAFKFGRAPGFKPTSHSVGQFGVGMKRALFKMGEEFSVKSAEPQASFTINVDVQNWVIDDTNWDFDIEDLVEGPDPDRVLGTTLEITKLVSEVAESFDDGFVAALRHNIRSKHQHAMNLGLQIAVNDEAIIPTSWTLLQGNGIAPAVRRFEDDLGGGSPMISRIYAGLGDSSRANAGWYVFCNGRCILEANQESVTGWDSITDAGVKIPKYHGQFARFRGYAFLDSEDASILPWNTTKTSLDQESPAYRRLLPRLIEVTRTVINFLNLLDHEKDLEINEKVLMDVVQRSRSIALERLTPSLTFTFTPPPPRGPAMARISYQKPRGEVDDLMSAIGAHNLKQVGEKSFEFAYESYVEED